MSVGVAQHLYCYCGKQPFGSAIGEKPRPMNFFNSAFCLTLCLIGKAPRYRSKNGTNISFDALKAFRRRYDNGPNRCDQVDGPCMTHNLLEIWSLESLSEKNKMFRTEFPLTRANLAYICLIARGTILGLDISSHQILPLICSVELKAQPNHQSARPQPDQGGYVSILTGLYCQEG
jgi:hypothetical protein